ncbi:MAG TPA: UDP-3-O-(3-hydroxymyristoyl)glucosamine N-acyltransferase [Vicinamibacterales bacterium]|nr:UDP-3-O-(3-hydroxymyristoyl)glucosamine N-acyltransferase [Vicinamibacterales bacterium]
MTLGELARRLECPVEGDAAIEIRRVAKIEEAGPGDLTFLANPKYASKLATTRASAVIMNGEAIAAPCAVIRSTSPYLTFARAAQVLSPDRPPAAGVHSLASVAAGATVDPTATIGAFAVIGAGATIGARTIIHPHVVIGDGTTIGPDCILHGHVSIRERCTIGARVIVQNGAVIGSDGYGFAQRADGSHEKIPQTAPVVIEDDVEIGANTTIDRPAVGETRIKAGTKIDNLVQIGHGVVLGRNVLLAAQVGIAGSTVLGDSVQFGGQVGVGGHLTIGDRVKAVGQSGITNSVDADEFVSGYPAIPNSEWKRSSVVFRKLPEMRRQLRALEERLRALEETKKKE